MPELPSNESVRAAVEAVMDPWPSPPSWLLRVSRPRYWHAVDLRLPERDFQILRHIQGYHSRSGDALLTLIDG